MSQILIDLQYISRRAGEAGSANVTSHSQLVSRGGAAAPELAWSVDEPGAESAQDTERRSWSHTSGIATIIVVCALWWPSWCTRCTRWPPIGATSRCRRHR